MADLTYHDIVLLLDTREQNPLEFGDMRTEVVSLDLADISVRGLEHVIRIERKSLPDLIGCVGRERERFDRQIERMLAYPTRAVVVESSWGAIELGQWQGKVTPQCVIGSVCGWIAKGVPVVMAGNRERSAQIIARMCFIAARRRYRELRTFAQSLEVG